jgi:uncharacterized Zn-binding protein involved in type VI secretion
LGKPAARVGDAHGCPLVTPGTNDPHVGGPIIGPGCKTVLIEGKPAATAGDTCACKGAEDKIISGSTGVFIGGKPAARQGDPCAHGGIVIGGSTVQKEEVFPSEGFALFTMRMKKISENTLLHCMGMMMMTRMMMIKCNTVFKKAP